MFQLFHLIMTSPLGVFLFGKAQDAIYAVIVVADCDECGFNDLGKLLFGGVAAALLVGVVVSVLYWKTKDKRKNQADFVSIRATSVKQDEVK